MQRGDLVVAEDDALLYEALQFIGDLDDDDSSLSPLSVDLEESPRDLQTDDSTMSNGFFTSLLAEAPILDTVEPVPLPVETVSVAMESTDSSPPPLVWPVTTPPAPPKPKGNPSRNKRRQELLYLRNLVGDLEDQLKVLKRKVGEQQRQLKLEKPDEDHAEAKALVRDAWEQLASRQYQQRQQSEMENIKLKRILEEQIQLGKSLVRLLSRKRPKLENVLPTRAEKRARHGTLSMSWDNEQIFATLLQSTDVEYPETSQMLIKAQRRIGDETNCHYVELVHDEKLGMVLQTVQSRILPFEYELVVQEFWASIPEIFKDLTPGFNDGFHDIDVAEDIAKTRFRVHASFGRTTGDVTVYMVDRRYTDAQRTVFLSAGYLDPTEIANTNMDGVYMRHKGWTVFEPVFPEIRTSESPTKAVTRMTSYFLTIPEVFEGLEDQTRKVGTLTNFTMAGLTIELDSRQQTFENRLFDRSCELVVQQK